MHCLHLYLLKICRSFEDMGMLYGSKYVQPGQSLLLLFWSRKTLIWRKTPKSVVLELSCFVDSLDCQTLFTSHRFAGSSFSPSNVLWRPYLQLVVPAFQCSYLLIRGLEALSWLIDMVEDLRCYFFTMNDKPTFSCREYALKVVF